MSKGPGHIAAMYGGNRENYLRATERYRIRMPQPITKLCAYTIDGYKMVDFSEIEARAFAALTCDPRNHFGKYAALRRKS